MFWNAAFLRQPRLRFSPNPPSQFQKIKSTLLIDWMRNKKTFSTNHLCFSDFLLMVTSQNSFSYWSNFLAVSILSFVHVSDILFTVLSNLKKVGKIQKINGNNKKAVLLITKNGKWKIYLDIEFWMIFVTNRKASKYRSCTFFKICS